MFIFLKIVIVYKHVVNEVSTILETTVFLACEKIEIYIKMCTCSEIGVHFEFVLHPVRRARETVMMCRSLLVLVCHVWPALNFSPLLTPPRERSH